MAATADLNPLDNPDIYDSIVIGTMVSPGLCQISNVKRTNDWDVKKGKGTMGATVTFVGREPVKFTLTFQLWRTQDFIDWGTFRKQFEFDPTKKSISAIGIFHPVLADLDINSVVCESIGGMTHKGKGMWEIEVELLEYFPPPKKAASGTPNGSKNTNASGTNGPPGKTADPIADAQQAEIAKLLEQAKGP